MSKSFYQLLKENAPFEEIKAAIESGNFGDDDSFDCDVPPLEEALLTKKVDERIVLLLIASGAYVEKGRSPHIGGSLLHEAILKKLGVEVISALISAGVDLSIKDYAGNTPLHIAVSKKAGLNIISALISARANVNTKNGDEETPLHIAVKKKANKGTIQALIEAGADLNAKERFYDRTPLHYAAMYKLPKAVLQLLIDAGADVNAIDSDGRTPLKEAKSCDYQEMVDLLIEHGAKESSLFSLIKDDASVEEIKTAIAEGADVNEKIRKFGETPLHKVANKPWRVDVIRLFIEAGADVNAHDIWSRTPLHYTTQSDPYEDEELEERKEGIKALIEAGADVNARTRDQETPLHLAAGMSSTEDIIRALVVAGADVNARDEDDSTPLHKAAFSSVMDGDVYEGVKALIESGADVNAKDDTGNTPLLLALGDTDYYGLGSLDVIRSLIEAGADVNARNDDGHTPLKILNIIEVGREDGDREIIEPYFALLRQAGAEF